MDIHLYLSKQAQVTIWLGLAKYSEPNVFHQLTGCIIMGQCDDSYCIGRHLRNRIFAYCGFILQSKHFKMGCMMSALWKSMLWYEHCKTNSTYYCYYVVICIKCVPVKHHCLWSSRLSNNDIHSIMDGCILFYLRRFNTLYHTWCNVINLPWVHPAISDHYWLAATITFHHAIWWFCLYCSGLHQQRIKGSCYYILDVKCCSLNNDNGYSLILHPGLQIPCYIVVTQFCLYTSLCSLQTETIDLPGFNYFISGYLWVTKQCCWHHYTNQRKQTGWTSYLP